MNKTKKIIIILLIVAFLVSIGIYLKSIITANTIKEQQKYEEWLKDNCNCTIKERLRCPEGYELNGKTCIGWKSFTNPVLTCSQYNCSGEIMDWDENKEKWN